MTDTGPDAPLWLLAQLKPGGFEQAQTNLARQGYASFMPIRQKTVRKSRKLVTKWVPLFPGYIFVGLGRERTWREINSTYGVARLVMRREHVPQPAPPDLMASLFARCDDEGRILPPERFAPGDRVRIVAGPMADLVAEVERAPDADRVRILLEMMGQAVRAELPREALERLER